MKNLLQLIFVMLPFFFFSQVKREKITLEHTNVTETTINTNTSESRSVNYTTIKFSTPTHKLESIGKYGINLEPFLKLDPEAYKEFENYKKNGKKMQRSAWIKTIGYVLIGVGILVVVLSNSSADKQALANGQEGHGITGGMIAGGVISGAGLTTAIISNRSFKKSVDAVSNSFYNSIDIYNKNIEAGKQFK